ncbi:endonuclease domain-containing protein [Cryobacterium sp. W22_MBD10_FK3]|uniref:endonuclease domain-containing protein n=1 Tax=Cryobacterium sp. W22_MBD10_FK3 TaxID=3240273 RepID=UPI003F92C378
MELGSWLNQQGGIAHSQQALRAGFTRFAIRRNVAEGVCTRIRRDWLALPTAPLDLSAAAALGGRVACLSVARRLELWYLPDGMNHVSMPRNGAVPASDTLRVHWSAGPVPVARFALVEPIENALVHVAACQPFENALVVWDSALNKNLVTQQSLARLPVRGAAARAVRDVASGLSDSGLETLPVARLAATGIRVSQQVMLDGHKVDGLIGDRLVLQSDGFSFHSSAEQRRADIAHDRRLALLGYTVLRYDYRQILFDWARIESEILRAMAQGLHLSRAEHRR